MASWTASGCQALEASCPEMDALEVEVQKIIDEGLTDLDIDLAVFAITSYARQNFIAHGETDDLSVSKDCTGLAEYIDNDDKLLEDILPDEEMPMVDNWRRLLMIRRKSHTRRAGDGDRKANDPLKVAPESI